MNTCLVRTCLSFYGAALLPLLIGGSCLVGAEAGAGAVAPLAGLIAAAALSPGESPGGASSLEGPVASDEHAELTRLELLAPAGIPMEGARLSSAITLVATACGMNFIAPTEETFSESVSMSTRISPWKLLQLLSERYHFSMKYRDGVWLFDRDTGDALISRSYVLVHTNLDQYRSSQNSFNLLAGSSGQATGQEGASPQVASGGLVFAAQTQKILDDIRELIGTPASTPSGSASVGAPGGGRVLYLPDANTLYVTGTVRQHEHVAEYLQVVDKPVRQIRIEAKFFETTHDPKLLLGIDPEGYQPGISLSNISTTVNLGAIRATPYPDKVLLTGDNLRFQLQALQTDDRSKLVNQPSVVVANNREAYFSVGDEEPFVSSNSYSPGMADGGFGSTQAHVAVRRIGTSVNLVPTYFPGSGPTSARIRLAVRIEVGVLKGFRRLNSVDVPIVSSQKYEYTVYLKPGETLAFGGMSGVTESESLHKVPIAGDIPILGLVFRSKAKQTMQRNLVAYLTATLIDDTSLAMAGGAR